MVAPCLLFRRPHVPCTCRSHVCEGYVLVSRRSLIMRLISQCAMHPALL